MCLNIESLHYELSKDSPARLYARMTISIREIDMISRMQVSAIFAYRFWKKAATAQAILYPLVSSFGIK